MTSEEAWLIFESWQDYMEVADKFRILMLTPPPSFLPYPPDRIQKALDIVSKELFEAGDISASDEIKRHATLHLIGYYFKSEGMVASDELCLEKMRDSLNLVLSDKVLTGKIVGNLRKSQESWIAHRRMIGRKSAK